MCHLRKYIQRQAFYYVIVIEKEASASTGEIISFCKQHLADYKTPKSIDFADALPKNATGKILKRELRLDFRLK